MSERHGTSRARRLVRITRGSLGVVLGALVLTACGSGEAERDTSSSSRSGGNAASDTDTPAGDNPGEAQPPVAADAKSDIVGTGTRLVATLGDSITAGTPGWDPDPVTRAGIDQPDPRNQWQHWAAGRNPELRFRNCGVNRERTDEIALRLERCLEGAKVLVVQGGINDLAQQYGVQHAERGLRGMVRAGKRAGANVLLTQVLPWNAGYPDFAPQINELNRRIGVLAAQEKVPLLTFYEALEDPQAPGRMRAAWTVDGSHPSTAGHRVLGETAFRLP